MTPRDGETRLRAGRQTRALLDALGDAVLVCDPSGRIVEANEAARRRMACGREELLSRSIAELVVQAEADAALRRVSETLKRGEMTFQAVRLACGGREVPCELCSLAIEYEGTPAVLCVIRDAASGGRPTVRPEELRQRLAELERTDRVLRKAHRFSESIIRRMGEGVCVCHDVPEPPYIRFTVWNDRMVEITGYTIEQINRLGWYQTMYPDPQLQARAKERMERMRRGDDLHAEPWEITRADGQKRILSISTSVLETGDGGTHVLAVMDDITERRQAERKLRLTQFSVDRAGDAVFWMDKEGRFFYVNDSACRVLGYSRDELLGMTASDISPDFPREIWPEHWRQLKEAGTLTFQTRHRRKDGTCFPV
ncbi:MAG: PAS domain S-box protein, partial [Planctomycetes bacterium]|nr:PAS domain S-box protein [Planctomycetota bacterium]